MALNKEYERPKVALMQMKHFIEDVLGLNFPKLKGSGENVFCLSQDKKDHPSRESEILLTLLRCKDELNSIFGSLFNSEAIGDPTADNFLVNSDIIKSSSRFMDSEQVFIRSLLNADEQVKISSPIYYGREIRKPNKAVIYILSYNDMCRYCRGTFSWFLASGGLKNAIKESLQKIMVDEEIDETIVKDLMPENNIDIQLYCSSLKNPEDCCVI